MILKLPLIMKPKLSDVLEVIKDFRKCDLTMGIIFAAVFIGYLIYNLTGMVVKRGY